MKNIKLEVKKFQALQKKYLDFGAFDTEPDTIFQNIIVQSIKGKSPVIPFNANGWELFTDMKGAEDAAQALSIQAKAVVAEIRKVRVSKITRLNDWAKEFCWRYDLETV